MVSTHTNTLSTASLCNPTKVNVYKKALSDIGCDSPYYAYELLNRVGDINEELQFFLFHNASNDLIAIMPYLYRKILLNGENTGYFDVISPWGYNGPFFKPTVSEKEIVCFWEVVDAWYKENKVVSEFLRFNLQKDYRYYSGTELHTLYNVQGDITDWERFWSNLKPNTRNQFRKAEKLGLIFELHFENIEEKHIVAFHALYISTMDRREAKDSFYLSLDYFLELWKNNPKQCAIGLVKQNGIAISTELFLMSSNTMYSFLGGTDANHFKLRPNEYLKINAIKWANEIGLTYYLIGGGLSNSIEDNLYLYKKKYFPLDEDVDFYTGRKIVMPNAYLELLKKAGYEHTDNTALENIWEGYFPKYRNVKR
ncbi:MAG: hypothetical protein ACI9SG_002122 [Maribacter sp.]|jgi:hypothetical protein